MQDLLRQKDGKLLELEGLVDFKTGLFVTGCAGFEKFCVEFGMLNFFGMEIAMLRMDFATEAALAF